MINEARLEQFAIAYVPSVVAAAKALGAYRPPTQSIEEYALEVALEMVEVVKRAGVQGIEHYGINTRGGAFRRTCESLGVECSPRALQEFIEGK